MARCWLATMTRISLLAVLALLGAQGRARADCEDGVAELVSAMATATDPHARDVLTRDLKQAQLDLWEFDEVECTAALQHAARFLRRETEATSNAAAPNAAGK